MTVRLTVQRAAWEHHVTALAAEVDGLVPVAKGNGYGFGRATLHPVAAQLSTRVCVGTVHELDHIEHGVTPVVLTPTLVAPATDRPILTVGSPAHVDALAGWGGRVVVKLRSSMNRYGVEPDELGALLDHVAAAGLTIDGTAIHLPLAGDDRARLAEIEAWVAVLPSGPELSVSHLSPACFAALQRAHPERRICLRLGTALWHGDKTFLHLGADVLDVHNVHQAPDHATAGYHGSPTPADAAALVLVGAGTANGLAALADGRSPFHFARRRLALLEPPHMHTSMCVVAAGDPVPATGVAVDVQRPLISTMIDELVWS